MVTIMAIEKNIYNEIIDVINESYKNKERAPKIRERGSYEFVGGKTLLIDIPKKSKIFYHGSSYNIDCDETNKKCNTKGELVIVLNTGKEVKDKLDNLSCNVAAIHDHDALSVKSTHVHFICENKNYDTTLKIAKFLKEY